MKNFSILIISLCLIGCSSLLNPLPGTQQLKVRYTIEQCKTFDCSVLPKEIILLKQMIKENSKYQGIQQSLVTSITKKCMSNVPSTPCKEYLKERNKLTY